MIRETNNYKNLFLILKNMRTQQELQLGKKGLTPEFLKAVEKRFEKRKVENIKIKVLKSARKSKEDVKKFGEILCNYLGDRFTFKVIGFSIFLKKWRKPRSEKNK